MNGDGDDEKRPLTYNRINNITEKTTTTAAAAAAQRNEEKKKLILCENRL